MAFYRYSNEAEMRRYNPLHADEIVKCAVRKTVRVCTSSDKRCIGSMPGNMFLYEDGSWDNGEDEVQYRSEYHGSTFAWSEVPDLESPWIRKCTSRGTSPN